MLRSLTRSPRTSLLSLLMVLSLGCGQPQGDNESPEEPELIGNLTLLNATHELQRFTLTFQEVLSASACQEIERAPELLKSPTFSLLTTYGPVDFELFSGEEIALFPEQWLNWGNGENWSVYERGGFCFITTLSSQRAPTQYLFSRSPLVGSYRSYFHNRWAPKRLEPTYDTLILVADYSKVQGERLGWREVTCPKTTNPNRIGGTCDTLSFSERQRASRMPQGATYSFFMKGDSWAFGEIKSLQVEQVTP